MVFLSFLVRSQRREINSEPNSNSGRLPAIHHKLTRNVHLPIYARDSKNTAGLQGSLMKQRVSKRVKQIIGTISGIIESFRNSRFQRCLENRDYTMQMQLRWVTTKKQK